MVSILERSKLKLRVEEKVLETICRAEENFNKKYSMPTIEYFRKGKVAGRAYYLDWKLKFNEVLLYENGDSFIERTPGHEVAHLIADGFGSRGHDKIWKQTMMKLGMPPVRCHNYDTSSVISGGAFYYFCACKKPHVFSKRRHNNVVLRGMTYTCRMCGVTLRRIK